MTEKETHESGTGNGARTLGLLQEDIVRTLARTRAHTRTTYVSDRKDENDAGTVPVHEISGSASTWDTITHGKVRS